MRNLSLLFLLIFSVSFFAQEKDEVNIEFSVKVRVIDDNTNLPLKDANVEVNGKRFFFSNIKDAYLVKARANDQLTVSYPEVETVIYTIKDDEDIKVLIEGLAPKNKTRINSLYKSSKKISVSLFDIYLDSVNRYKRNDLDKSLTFIEKMLKDSDTKTKRAISFKNLADVYAHWKQYDLAIENYKASLKEIDNNQVLLTLAKTELLALKSGDARRSFSKALNENLSNYERLTAYEGLGDAYKNLQKFNKAKESYEKALQIAQDNLITPKITDLNSKLAEVFAAEGDGRKADSYYKNSLDLASKENRKRSLKEQQKVADYYNQSQRYDDEIKLRKESLENAEDVVVDAEEKESLVDSITSQKINYKIGNAYALKQEYTNAIPYLKKSIVEANKKEDLIIQKDATRKLSEILATVGNYSEALKTYQEYVQLVDTLYSRKEQEIQQVKRFGKRIADNQSRIKSLEKDKALADSKIDLAYKDQQLTEENNKRQKLIIYSLIAGVLLMILLVYYMNRTNRQQKIANNLLALKSMRSQMNPHFIFNALNSVNSFIAVNDERSANRYLSEFSVLMRSVLENSDEDFIPLSKEIELLELYVKLEHNRFQDKFDYTISIDEQIRMEDYSIPPMLLQPYIENAIWHGLRYKEEKGNLQISMSQKDDNSIAIIIEDDGVGRRRSKEMKTKNQLKQKSKGMSTIQNRIDILNDMYQDKISVLVSNVFEDETGTRVELILKKD